MRFERNRSSKQTHETLKRIEGKGKQSLVDKQETCMFLEHFIYLQLETGPSTAKLLSQFVVHLLR